jgi:lysophospholipase L1-like esterase
MSRGRRRTLTSTAGVSGVALVSLLAVAGCGHSSDSTGPSSGSSSSASGADLGTNDPRKASAFGDSITFGVLEERKRVIVKLTTQNNYPNDLQAMLQGLDPAWRVVNRGAPGEVVEQGASRIVGVLKVDQPGYILIMEGTNNASREDDPSFIVSFLQSMVGSARANKTIPVLGTIPPNFRNDPGAQDVIASANDMIRTLAQSQGVTLAEIFNGMNDRSLFGQSLDTDPLHPNDQGYRVMSQIWFNALLKVATNGGRALALRPKTPGKAAVAPQAPKK